jgi:ABC-type multidrug transport system fused ATPase/permease subunit
MSTTHERLSFSEFLARVERVARLFGQLARDGTSDGRSRVVIVTAMSFLGASAQAGTIAALNFFVKAIESEVPKLVPYLGFPIQSDARTLLALTVVVLGLQLVNAVAIYYVAITSRAIARAFHLKAATQTLEAFSRVPYLRPGLADARQELRASVVRYPRIMGMAVEQMVGALQAVCYVIGFLVVLFTISVEISLFTLPVFLLVLPFLYRLSTQTQKVAKSFYGHVRQQARIFAQDQLRASDQTNVHPTLYGAAHTQRYRDSEVVQNYLDSYDQIRLSQRRSILITSLFRGFLLCLMLAVLGTFSIRGTYSWGELLVYVLALWQLANQVQTMTASLVNLNRFQPRIVGYYLVQDALAKASTDPPAAKLEGALVISSEGRLDGDAGRLEVTRGDRIFFLTDGTLSRMEFASVLAPLLAASPKQKAVLRAASFCSGAEVCPRLSVSAMVLGSEAASTDERADLEARIAELGLAQELAMLPDGSTTYLSKEIWSGVSQKFRAALRILSLAESPSDILFIDWGLLGSVEKEAATRLLAMLDDRIVFLVSRDGRIECEWATGFVVSENQEVVGVGDARWWEAVLPYRRQRVPRRRAEAGMDDDEDEEDE